ncbi:signal peptidase I [Tichowtungia aerotolerans]|uniref:Signal peptidase I n=1 Tax=Tichowtungia aerotolerans TaxID=2697043 RepID=A0A6P1MH91_9BACT|nr:signal peptidase I [Tichowtungia aerotolerans]QHI70445.1 signal peptidase I [Tichowtungia aerotolerans]
MNFFKIRKARKELKEILHHAKHIRHMHEDIGDPQLLSELKSAEERAQNIRKGTDVTAMEAVGSEVCDICEKVAPPRPQHKIRENVEVLFVAIAAAMAIRAHFFQPFKIPTGSMQPTLYGITVRPLEEGESTALPVRIAKFFWKGEVFLNNDTLFDRLAKLVTVGKEYTATAHADGYIRMHEIDGRVLPDYRDNFDGGKTITIYLGNTPHVVSQATVRYSRYGEYIRKGESMLRGVAKAGDYILVNRMKYNFFPPKRGDIVVFDAKDVARDAYYIKRLVGLPDETVSVNPPYLTVNGKKPTDRRFQKLFHNDKYNGYVYGTYASNLTPLIGKPGESITLANDEYLFFGDNTLNSLDGRYFGGVKQERLLGTAFFVGLPFDRAGRVETIH